MAQATAPVLDSTHCMVSDDAIAQPLPAGYLASTALYGAVYIALLLVASVAVFSRRDFK